MKATIAQILASLLAIAASASLDPPTPVDAPQEVLDLASRFVEALQRGDRGVVASAISTDFTAHFAAEHEFGATDQILHADAFLDRALGLATWQCPFQRSGAAKEAALYLLEFECSKTMVAPNSRIQIHSIRLTIKITREPGEVTGLWVVWKLPDDVPYPIEP